MGQVQIYSLGKRCNVRPPAESHTWLNQSPAWKMSTSWHPLAGRHCWEWSEIIHYLRASFVTFPLRVATMQTHLIFGNYSCWTNVTFSLFRSVASLRVPLSLWRPFRCGTLLGVLCPASFCQFLQVHCLSGSPSGAWHPGNVKHLIEGWRWQEKKVSHWVIVSVVF